MLHVVLCVIATSLEFHTESGFGNAGVAAACRRRVSCSCSAWDVDCWGGQLLDNSCEDRSPAPQDMGAAGQNLPAGAQVRWARGVATSRGAGTAVSTVSSVCALGFSVPPKARRLKCTALRSLCSSGLGWAREFQESTVAKWCRAGSLQ